MDKPKFTYNGHSFGFSMDDYEDALRYQSALGALAKEQVPERAVNPSGYIKGYCEAMGRFFDTALKEGAASKMFGDKLDKRLYDDAYGAFLDFVTQQVKESNTRIAKLVQKYAPKQEEKHEPFNGSAAHSR